MKTAVVALGGNAILRRKDRASVDAQFRNVRKAAAGIERLRKKYRLILTHGNGPQVGNIMVRSELALGKAYAVPLHVAVAESEGEIGYIMQQVLQNRLRETVVSLLTQVLVRRDDEAFRKPTKPIGPFYSKQQASRLRRKGMTIQKIDHGYRRVVPSPRPREIIEADAIRKLSHLHCLVIAAGGGGIPVIREKGKLRGVDAVIDKDRAAACLARNVKADALFLLTDVPCAYINYGTKKQKQVKNMSVREARTFLSQGQFPAGSMGPKVEAALDFLAHNRSGRVIIGSIEHPERGTVITA